MLHTHSAHSKRTRAQHWSHLQRAARFKWIRREAPHRRRIDSIGKTSSLILAMVGSSMMLSEFDLIVVIIPCASSHTLTLSQAVWAGFTGWFSSRWANRDLARSRLTGHLLLGDQFDKISNVAPSFRCGTLGKLDILFMERGEPQCFQAQRYRVWVSEFGW